jgi:hypothetical protein
MTAAHLAVPAEIARYQPPVLVPLAVTVAVAVATVALVAIGIFVRRARLRGRLSGVNAVAGGISAAGILISALLVSVALGSATASTASVIPAHPGSIIINQPVANQPAGYQLSTP